MNKIRKIEKIWKIRKIHENSGKIFGNKTTRIWIQYIQNSKQLMWSNSNRSLHALRKDLSKIKSFFRISKEFNPKFSFWSFLIKEKIEICGKIIQKKVQKKIPLNYFAFKDVKILNHFWEGPASNPKGNNILNFQLSAWRKRKTLWKFKRKKENHLTDALKHSWLLLNSFAFIRFSTLGCVHLLRGTFGFPSPP